MGATRTTYQTVGSSALKAQNRPYLRLVPGNAKPSRANARVARPRVRRRGASIRAITLACVLSMLLCTCVFALDTYHSSSVDSRLDASPKETVFVVSGDTMWGIAESHRVDGVSTKELVRWMRINNNLEGSSLRPGMMLLVPAQAQ